MNKKYGLTTEQALANRRDYGSNELTQRELDSFWDMLKDTLQDTWLKILFAALILEMVFYGIGRIWPDMGSDDWFSPVAIFIVIVAVSFIGTYINYKQEKGAQALQNEASQITCKVFRDGKLTEISINDIVMQDAVYLQPGDKVPADGILLEGSVQVEQSALNGESREANKKVLPTGMEIPGSEDLFTEYKCFRGSVVTSGSAVMLVTEVGDNTVLGSINVSLQEKDDTKTPAEEKLDKLAQGIGIFGYCGGSAAAIIHLVSGIIAKSHNTIFYTICIIVFSLLTGAVIAVVGQKIMRKFRGILPAPNYIHTKFYLFLIKNIKFCIIILLKGLSYIFQVLSVFVSVVLILMMIAGITFGFAAFILLTSLVLGVSIVVMAVPEGLPLMNTMVQGLNVGKMLKAHIYVKNSKATETAGYLTHVFTDKTGTLTNGRMTVTNVITGDSNIYVAYDTIPDSIKNDIIIGAGVNNDATISGDGKAIGSNDTDRALMAYLAIENNVVIDKNVAESREPFDSRVKYAAVTLPNGMRYLKGAPDIIIKNCTGYVDKDGNIQPMTDEVMSKLENTWDTQTERAMRVIAILKEYDNEKIFVALISIRDDVRSDVKKTIQKMYNAGVRVTMVTGDVLATARAIAREAGLITNPDDLCISHDELAQMSDEDLRINLPRLKVVARAIPSDKERLVNIGRSIGEVVGMTGDGVNDAPALHKADIGFAMGSGTEVAKEAGDIIILNDSLTSIADAIMYGRTMSKSVKKFLIFQLTVNVSTVFTAVLGALFGWTEVFTIVQILWINMIMDTLAAIAFGQEPPRESYMNEKPVSRSADILNSYLKSEILVGGVFITMICLSILQNIFGVVHNIIGSSEMLNIRTFMFSAFIMAIIWNSLNARTESMNLFEHITENRNFILVMTMVTIIQVVIIQFGGKVFGTSPLTMENWLTVILLTLVIIPIDLVRKYIVKRMGILE